MISLEAIYCKNLSKTVYDTSQKCKAEVFLLILCDVLCRSSFPPGMQFAIATGGFLLLGAPFIDGPSLMFAPI